ncbi:arylsulfatase [Homoserinimonas aerilata]|uniref:Arylsulfatase n=1 Tax=Homoserinimonas aerilata TaxID=1162970 RepID=A0A542YK02_9MICO|nr:arylsulfatase [Homoserinimonas aerilata]TQL48395.1 arylsulfatase [Homoserinimonas aerilata]
MNGVPFVSPQAVPEGARGYEDFGGSVDRAMSRSTPAWVPSPKPEAGAPNVILMVIDDMGFSDLGPYGGEIPTPHVEAIVDDGVVLNNYHTASVCSPARAAILTGVNPHRAGFATVAGFNPGFPGFALELGDDVLTLPEALQGAGYATFGIGKWHLTRDDATFEGASRESWPVQRGFDQYYGCLEGFTNFFAPNRLVQDNTTVEVERYPDDYYLTDDLTDHAISMIRGLRTSESEKPFFLYFAHNAMHGPLGAKAEDIDRHRGRYAEGWDEVRRARFAEQIARGLFPEGTQMVDRNREGGYEVEPWQSLDEDSRARFERYMEVYAAMVDNIDQNLGRLLSVLDEYGERENTIVIVTSDNGGTAEGGPEGTRSYLSQFINGLRLPEDWSRDQPIETELIGGPRAGVHYPRGWAMASNTPFRLYKGSTFGGGVRAPFIFSWPARLRNVPAAERVRRQFMYATDIMPTLLEACGVVRPSERHGIPAKDLDGLSALDQLLGSASNEFRMTQHAEWNGHLGLYHEGWKILSLRPGPIMDVENVTWQLYEVTNDPAETHDLAADRPEKVAELAALWERLAWENTVFPIADDAGLVFQIQPRENARFSEPLVIRNGSPTVERHRAAQLIGLREFRIRASVVAAGEGVLVAHGDQCGGYVLYVEDGRLVFEYNEYGVMRTTDAPFTASGPCEIELDLTFNRDEFYLDVELSVDGVPVASLRRVMMLTGLAPFTGIDVGIDRRGPVSWEMHERHGAFPFSGELTSVRYEPGEPAPYDAGRLAAAAFMAAHHYD